MARLGWLLAAALAWCATPVASQQERDVPVLAADDDFYEDEGLLRVFDLAGRDNRVGAHLHELTQEIGSRLAGSRGLERATEWAVERFRSFGYEPRLEACGTLPVGFDRGPARGGMVAPETQAYEFITWAWTPGTNGPTRGRALLYPRSLEALEAEAEAYRGAWVVRTSPRDLPSFEERARIEARLEELGAAGHVRRGGREQLVMSGNPAVDPAALPTRVVVRVEDTHYADLLERLERAEPVELQFDIENRFRPGPVPLHNVVCDLVGSELPDEYVLVGAHLDSWDAAEGAHDNGTGVATTLEVARLLKAAGIRPRRTIRFVLWTGGELDRLGSRAYVEAHRDELPRTSAVLVHDGGTNFISGIAGPESVVGDLERAFLPLIHLEPSKPFRIVQNDGLSREGGSDHVPFVRAGVPAFFWRQNGRSNYGLVHHTQLDVLESVVDEYQRHSVLVIAVGAYNLARLEERLSRVGLLERLPRRLGVYLDETTVVRVVEGKAKEAGWLAGDVVVSVGGVKVETREELLRAVSEGAERVVFVLRRGEGELEVVLDWGRGG